MSEQNNNQMREIQEAIALRHVLNSNEGYSDPNTWTVEGIVKSQERLIIEGVDVNIAPTSVLEEMIKHFNELKKLSVVEFTAGRTDPKVFEGQQVAMQEAMTFLYDITSVRYQHAQLKPGKWSELIVSHVAGDNIRTEKEKIEVVRYVTEARWKYDQTLVEFDGYLRMKKLRENYENF